MSTPSAAMPYSMDDLRIVNGRVYIDGEMRDVAVGIRDGKISRIGAEAPAKETIDAAGKWVLPGLIDTQVHFREPGLTHKETIGSGSLAAIAGGITTYFEMPNTQPATTTEERLNEKLSIAARTSWANYAFFVGAATDNLHELERLEMLPGAAGVKIFIGSSTGSLLLEGEEDLVTALRNGRRRVSAHCEDEPRNRERKALLPEGGGVEWHPRLRDAESATLAVERYIAAGAETGRPIHVLHVSASEELGLIRAAKQKGLDVTSEVTPQHLWFSADDYARMGTHIQQNPPIRDKGHRFALRAALQAGEFDVFGSDHAPHTIEEKSKPYPQSPSGMPGVQTSLRILLALGVSPMVIGEMFCARPAELFRIKSKGRIIEGYDADLIVVDGETKSTIQTAEMRSSVGWTPFEGVEAPRGATHTILGGRLVFADGAPIGDPSGAMVQFDLS